MSPMVMLVPTLSQSLLTGFRILPTSQANTLNPVSPLLNGQMGTFAWRLTETLPRDLGGGSRFLRADSIKVGRDMAHRGTLRSYLEGMSDSFEITRCLRGLYSISATN